MSRSTPFFNTKRATPKRDNFIDEQEFKHMHWSKQLALRPLRNKTRREWPEGDFNTQIDCWDDDNDNIEEIAQ